MVLNRQPNMLRAERSAALKQRAKRLLIHNRPTGKWKDNVIAPSPHLIPIIADYLMQIYQAPIVCTRCVSSVTAFVIEKKSPAR